MTPHAPTIPTRHARACATLCARGASSRAHPPHTTSIFQVSCVFLTAAWLGGTHPARETTGPAWGMRLAQRYTGAAGADARVATNPGAYRHVQTQAWQVPKRQQTRAWSGSKQHQTRTRQGFRQHQTQTQPGFKQHQTQTQPGFKQPKPKPSRVSNNPNPAANGKAGF